MCLGVDEKKEATKQYGSDTEKRCQTLKSDAQHNGELLVTANFLLCWYKGRHSTSWFTFPCASWFCWAEPQTTPTAFLWTEYSPSSSAVKTAAIFYHNRVHLSMVLPSVPLFLCSSPLFVVGGLFLFPIQHQTTISTGSWAAQQGGGLNTLLSFSKLQMNKPHSFFSGVHRQTDWRFFFLTQDLFQISSFSEFFFLNQHLKLLFWLRQHLCDSFELTQKRFSGKL